MLSSGTVDESGYVVLVFDPIAEPGTLDLVITSQNTHIVGGGVLGEELGKNMIKI